MSEKEKNLKKPNRNRNLNRSKLLHLADDMSQRTTIMYNQYLSNYKEMIAAPQSLL
jgi:hypothetical protein